jgi:hypothetical protein
MGTTRRALMVAVALSSLAVGGTAAAGYIDGNKLFEECQRSDDPDEPALPPRSP